MRIAIAAAAVVLVAGCGSHGATVDAPAADAMVDARRDAPGDAASCACTFGSATTTGEAMVGDGELSGIVVSRNLPNLLWTHDDSGGSSSIFAVDFTGAAHGLLSLTGVTQVDWEDIAIAQCADAATGWCLFVSDTGDNDLKRASVAVYRVAEPAAAPEATSDVTFTRFDLVYPDGPHNVESLFIDPRDGSAYVITKVKGGPGVVYRMPLVDGAMQTAVEIGSLTIPDAGDTRITAADLFIDGCGSRLLVRTNTHLYELSSDASATIDTLLLAPLVEVPVAVEQQGEAVGFLPSGRGYVTTSEGSPAPIDVVTCTP